MMAANGRSRRAQPRRLLSLCTRPTRFAAFRYPPIVFISGHPRSQVRLPQDLQEPFPRGILAKANERILNEVAPLSVRLQREASRWRKQVN